MTLQSRLSKATQSLSPLQRAVLVVQAAREGRELGPELRRIDDGVQRRAFNRYMGLLWVANYHLGAIVAITAYRVEVAEQDAHYYKLLNEAATLIEEHEGLMPAKAVRNWRRKEITTAPEMLRGMALERKADATTIIQLLWRETLGVEAVWSELAEDFGGEDIIMPDLRERHANAQERLRAIAKTVGLKRLPSEPGDELTRSFREAVSDSFHHLGYSEA
jgi:hypothetical protein